MKLLTASELAAQLGISPRSVYLYAKQGTLPYLRIGRHLRFELETVVGALRKGSDDCQSSVPMLSGSKPDFDRLSELVNRSLTIGRTPTPTNKE
jgi:excisionase family DNA binding protein